MNRDNLSTLIWFVLLLAAIFAVNMFKTHAAQICEELCVETGKEFYSYSLGGCVCSTKTMNGYINISDDFTFPCNYNEQKERVQQT